jgi:hypothetical protein
MEMRKILLAGVFVAFAAPAFAGIVAGDVNASNTTAGSVGGVVSAQGTQSSSTVSNGWAVGGAVSGNYTNLNSSAQAHATPAGSSTKINTNQTSVGGTITGGAAEGNATTTSSGAQGSIAAGGSKATATNTNVGGFVFSTHRH